MALETIFTMDAAGIKFGPGSTREVGEDMASFGAKRVMVCTDPRVAQLEPVAITMKALKQAGVDAVLFDGSRTEPTDTSVLEAIAFAKGGKFDGFVAVGGGSSIDTCKMANLYSTYPSEDLLEYVNAPVGKATPIPGPLKPLVAIPTTAGTGSETTGVAVFDLTQQHVKTAVSQKRLRPKLGIIDPENTRTLPPMVAAGAGLDVICHAIESLTNIRYSQRPKAPSAAARPSYQGSNPISDVWAKRAVELVSQNIERAMQDPGDDEAREAMMLASTFAGIGFGNAGVQLPHAMSYPVSGMVRDYIPEGYPKDHPIIPHGMAVILNAPAAFRFGAQANPELHLEMAQLMGADVRDAAPEDAGERLAAATIDFMRKVGVPNGLSAIGFSENDLDDLVKGASAQHRITKLAPRPFNENDLREMFRDAMRYW